MEPSSPKKAGSAAVCGAGASPRRGPMDIATLLGAPPSPIIDPEDSASSTESGPMVSSPKTEPEDSVKVRVYSGLDEDIRTGEQSQNANDIN